MAGNLREGDLSMHFSCHGCFWALASKLSSDFGFDEKLLWTLKSFYYKDHWRDNKINKQQSEDEGNVGEKVKRVQVDLQVILY